MMVNSKLKGSWLSDEWTQVLALHQTKLEGTTGALGLAAFWLRALILFGGSDSMIRGRSLVGRCQRPNHL